QPSLRVAFGTIAQTGQSLGVVAHHRVAPRLALHPGKPRRRSTAHPIQRVGDRVKAGRNPPVPFPPRQPTQLGGRAVFLDLERYPHPSPHIWWKPKGITIRSAREAPSPINRSPVLVPIARDPQRWQTG